jgi:hypothetical protein
VGRALNDPLIKRNTLRAIMAALLECDYKGGFVCFKVFARDLQGRTNCRVVNGRRPFRSIVGFIENHAYDYGHKEDNDV